MSEYKLETRGKAWNVARPAEQCRPLANSSETNPSADRVVALPRCLQLPTLNLELGGHIDPELKKNGQDHMVIKCVASVGLQFDTTAWNFYFSFLFPELSMLFRVQWRRQDSVRQNTAMK